MEIVKFREIYKIDDVRLKKYFERIKNQFRNIDPIQTTAMFLENQSIGTNINEISEILHYYKDKIHEEFNLLDFALEWIRANEIRLEYKKYLIRATYPNGDLALAIDDCLFLFFLDYDKYIRKILSPHIEEFEISALYEIFFSPYDKKHLDIKNILSWHKVRVPTVFDKNEKVNSSVLTLRSGLSRIIVADYEKVLYSRKEEAELKSKKVIIKHELPEKKVLDFEGTRLTSMIKAYCFTKRGLPQKEIENAVSQFLSSYFNFGRFYKYTEFKDNLVRRYSDNIMAGLTKEYENKTPEPFLNSLIYNTLKVFREIHKIEVLDGLSWVNDIKPVLTSITNKLLDYWSKSKDPEIENKLELESNEVKNEMELKIINFRALFDLNLSVKTFRETLEELLKKNTELNSIERRNFLRTKVHEYRMQKRKVLMKDR